MDFLCGVWFYIMFPFSVDNMFLPANLFSIIIILFYNSNYQIKTYELKMKKKKSNNSSFLFIVCFHSFISTVIVN